MIRQPRRLGVQRGELQCRLRSETLDGRHDCRLPRGSASTGVPDIQRTDIVAPHYDRCVIPLAANGVLVVLCVFALAEIRGMRLDGSTWCRNIRCFREEPCERFLWDEE